MDIKFDNDKDANSVLESDDENDIQEALNVSREANEVRKACNTLKSGSGMKSQGRWTTLDSVFFMINVYGPQETGEKIALWNRLLQFMSNHEGHFVLFGDLNEVRDESLLELPLGVRNFTWMNKAGSKMSKLDHFLISQHVTDIFPDVKVMALPRGWSDHSSILLYCDKIDYGPAYEECLITNSQLSFHEKLRHLKNTIKNWNHQAKCNDMSRKHEVMRKLKDIEEKIDSNTALDSEKEGRMKLLKERDDIQHLEDMDSMQKARVKWDVEGDKNSKFFHGILKQKMSHQTVQGIMIDGNWVTNPHQVKTAFCDFYKDKFDISDSLTDLSTVTPLHTLNHNDNLELEKNVSNDEIWLAVWDCRSQKAPGPNGYSFLFLKTYWDLLKDDVVKAVRGVFDSCEMPKVLANRLSKVIDKVVCKEQSVFISGRFILDGPLMLSKIMSWYKKKKRNLMVFKVDFEKASDTVSWKFLDHMLSSLGFGNKWRKWINACLHSARAARASVLINGSPTSEFSIKRGLRQADPLSPFLFIIVMEGLHIALQNAVSSGLIQGASIGDSGYNISHIFYSDDVVIISDWNRQDMINIIHVLHVFYLALSLKINVSKSNVYGLGLNPQDIEDMARDTRCIVFELDYPLGNLTRYPLGGRLTLIKSVLGSLGIYYLSIFKCPESVLNSLELMQASLFSGERQVEGSRNEAALDSLLSDLGQVQILDEPDSWQWTVTFYIF
ncbi:putative RNA-directed DNA polymerase, eukaryota, reverse transcriptase zinc-binding domain protein, partial [Tanacetum coccineum]